MTRVARTTSSITIRRPIEDVFAVLTDVEKTAAWFPGDVEEHWTSRPPHGVGSTRHAVVNMFGRRTENDAVTTVYEPPHRAELRGTSPNAPFLATLVFAPDGQGTRVEVTTTLEGGGAMRLVGPVFMILYGRAWARGLARLKAMMESGAL
ncbi:MAG: SRPBCC family protein [Chloroflexota bacterium]